VKTTVYHASKEISTEADFQDIFKLHHYPYGLKPTAIQIHVLVDFSVSSWGRLIPTEYRQFITLLWTSSKIFVWSFIILLLIEKKIVQ
jgi:hypothetical protein